MTKLDNNPIIAAVRSETDLKEAVNTSVEIIFLLRSSILTLPRMIETVHEKSKLIFVHSDFSDGIGNDKDGIAYLKSLGVDGIISTRSAIIKHARELGLLTVQRFFIVDSHSIDTAIDAINIARPDMIEIMPGIMSKIIERFSEAVRAPVIAGGLIETKQEVIDALSAGATGISTNAKKLWNA